MYVFSEEINIVCVVFVFVYPISILLELKGLVLVFLDFNWNNAAHLYACRILISLRTKKPHNKEKEEYRTRTLINWQHKRWVLLHSNQIWLVVQPRLCCWIATREVPVLLLLRTQCFTTTTLYSPRHTNNKTPLLWFTQIWPATLLGIRQQHPMFLLATLLGCNNLIIMMLQTLIRCTIQPKTFQWITAGQKNWMIWPRWLAIVSEFV